MCFNKRDTNHLVYILETEMCLFRVIVSKIPIFETSQNFKFYLYIFSQLFDGLEFVNRNFLGDTPQKSFGLTFPEMYSICILF